MTAPHPAITAAPSAETFVGSLPDDRWYCPVTHTWLKPIGKGQWQLGATAFGLWLAGSVVAFTCKPRGAQVELDRGLATIESAKTVLAVRAPVALHLLQGNDEAEEQPKLVRKDPHGAGWMAIVEVTDPQAAMTLSQAPGADAAASPNTSGAHRATRLVDAQGYRLACLALCADAQITVQPAT